MRDLVEAALVEAAVAQGPELGRQGAGRGLQESGQEDVIGAEPDPVAAQRPAALLVEAAHLVRHLGALEDAERLDDLVADALGEPGEVGGGLDLHQRPEEAHHVGLEPGVEAPLDLLAGRAGQALVGDQAQARLEQLVAGYELGHRITRPADDALVAEDERGIGGGGEPVGARLDLPGQRLLGGTAQRLGLVPLRARVGHELETVEVADMLPLDGHVPAGGDLGFQHRILSQAPHQDAGAPVDETAREAFVQGVGQPVLYPTSLALPMFRVEKPVRTIRHEGPGPSLRNALGKRVDVTIRAVDHRHVLGKPVVRDPPRHAPHQESIELRHEVRVGLRVDLAVIRHAADVPEALHRLRVRRHVADVLLAHQDLEGLLVLAHRRPDEAALARVLVEALLQARQVVEVEIGVAPLQDAQGFEAVGLQRLDHLGLEGRAAPGGAEGAVREVAPGPARDLAHLGRRQLAEAGAVVFPVGREGHVVDVEVQAHADRVGGHKVIHVPRLVELDLGVSGAGRERAQHHRGAPALAPDQFRDGVDLLGRERHDGGAARQARELLLAREAELGQARPGRGVNPRDQRLHQRQHRRGADQQGLLAAALIEQAVGEDVAAVHVGGELDLVDGHEGDVEVARHRLDRGDPIARPVRLDLLLAGDQRHLVGADPGDDAQVDLPREQPQRQPDHPGRVGEHALDGQVGLAGIGRPEHRRDAACAGLRLEGAAGHQVGAIPSAGRPVVRRARRRRVIGSRAG
ncbi:hypothetical protein AEGHOMDF_0638 [Methylobacterium soli]|nr:hypothetical protein AEGHOMDF_0638 [Methylobacterium soli]